MDYSDRNQKISFVDLVRGKSFTIQKSFELLSTKLKEATKLISHISVNGSILQTHLRSRRIKQEILFTSGKSEDKSFMQRHTGEKHNRYEPLCKILQEDLTEKHILYSQWKKEVED